MNSLRLSICIATRNRADLLALTLDSLLVQVGSRVEIVIVDGASTDHTRSVVAECQLQHPSVKYFPQQENSGVDGDYDKAVAYAKGDYCWLISDDDLLCEGAVARILEMVEENPDALIVDAEVHSSDYSVRVLERRFKFSGLRSYAPSEMSALLADCGDALTFIGALVIRRKVWLTRDRRRYYGSEFVHVGVLFQARMAGNVVAVGEPMLRIRYGVGNWTKRAFEVWMLKWPALIWSFEHLTVQSRQAVVGQFPWRSIKRLLLFKAKGWYSWQSFRNHVLPLRKSAIHKVPAFLVALFPGYLAFLVVKVVLVLVPGSFHGTRWELSQSSFARK
jgi:abequosyltransferase